MAEAVGVGWGSALGLSGRRPGGEEEKEDALSCQQPATPSLMVQCPPLSTAERASGDAAEGQSGEGESSKGRPPVPRPNPPSSGGPRST